jgi:hypothetical protein
MFLGHHRALVPAVGRQRGRLCAGLFNLVKADLDEVKQADYALATVRPVRSSSRAPSARWEGGGDGDRDDLP